MLWAKAATHHGRLIFLANGAQRLKNVSYVGRYVGLILEEKNCHGAPLGISRYPPDDHPGRDAANDAIGSTNIKLFSAGRPAENNIMSSSPHVVVLPPQHHDPLVRTSQTLLLDSQIRDWVVLPLLVIMICAGLLRSHVGRLLRPSPKPIPNIDARAKSSLARVSRLRGGAGCYLSSGRWEARRLAWSARGGGGGGGEGGGSPLSSSSLVGAGSNNNAGWLRVEANRAEAEKKLQDEMQGGVDDPMTSSLIPGMDPSTMMVSWTNRADHV